MKNEYKQTIILYWAFLAGQFIFGMVVIFLLQSEPETHLSWPSAGFPGILGPIIILAGFTGARAVNRTNMRHAPTDAALAEKTAHFRKSVIMRSALMEGCNLIMVVFGMLEYNYFWILCFAAGILGFWFFKPTMEEFAEHYKLTNHDIRTLEA